MPNLSSAIIGEDGTVDPGYLGLFVVMWMILGTIPIALILIGVRMFIITEHPLDLVGLAAIIGAAGTAFGAAAVGVGVFRRGDQPHASVATTTTTTTASTPAVPIPVAITPDTLQSAGRGVEPMPAKIGPEDVGKKPLLSATKPKRRKRGRKA